MVDYTDDWGTESGLIDDIVLRVDESRFGTDMRYNNGDTLLLNWKGKTDQPIGSDGEFEFTVSYPCGGGWVSNDNGESAVNENGKAKFNPQSILGRVVTSAMEGKDNGGLGIFDILKTRGRSVEAKVWKGLTFRLKVVEFNYGGEIGKKSRLMPVEFLGENVDPADFAKTGTTDAAAAASAAKTETPTTASPAALEARLRAMAKVAPDHGTFVDKALEIPAVSEDAALLERVVDESKLWTEARV